MADWGSPVSGSGFNGFGGQVLCVPNATTHTKGGWYSLGTLAKTGMVVLQISWGQNYTTHRTLLFDFAVGALGQEKTILSNLMVAFSEVGANASRAQCAEILIPITLPAGSAISAKCQSSYASNAGAYVSFLSSNIPCSWTGSVIDTYGANTATSAGTTMTADNAAFTMGAYAQLTASCERMECFFVAVSPRTAQSAYSDQNGYFELALGSAGNEKVIASGTPEVSLGTKLTTPQWFGPYYHQVSAGQRLSARLQRQFTTSQRTLDIIVYGVR